MHFRVKGIFQVTSTPFLCASTSDGRTGVGPAEGSLELRWPLLLCCEVDPLRRLTGVPPWTGSDMPGEVLTSFNCFKLPSIVCRRLDKLATILQGGRSEVGRLSSLSVCSLKLFTHRESFSILASILTFSVIR